LTSVNGNESKYTMLFNDYINVIAELENEEKGILFDKILHYANGIDLDISDNRAATITWAGFKNQMDRDLAKYDNTIATNSIGGKKSSLKKWHKDLYSKVEAKEMSLDEAFVIVKDRKSSKSTYKNDESTHKNHKSTQEIISNKKKNTNTNTNNNNNTNTNILTDTSGMDLIELSEHNRKIALEKLANANKSSIQYTDIFEKLWDSNPSTREVKRSGVDLKQRVGLIYNTIAKRVTDKKDTAKIIYNTSIEIEENYKTHTSYDFNNTILGGIKLAFGGDRYPSTTLQNYITKGIGLRITERNNRFE